MSFEKVGVFLIRLAGNALFIGIIWLFLFQIVGFAFFDINKEEPYKSIQNFLFILLLFSYIYAVVYCVFWKKK